MPHYLPVWFALGCGYYDDGSGSRPVCVLVCVCSGGGGRGGGGGLFQERADREREECDSD